MAPRPQPQRLEHPLNADQVEALDQMLQELYDDVGNGSIFTTGIFATGILPVTSGGTGIGTVFTAGAVVFAGPLGIYAQDSANLFWDDANNWLGIGTATPLGPHHVVNPSETAQASFIIDQSANTPNLAEWRLDGTPVIDFTFDSQAAKNAALIMRANTVDKILLMTAGDSYFNGGNVGIGTAVFPATGTFSLIFGDGTIPATMASNTAGFYANDVSGTVEMFGINEAGVATQLTGSGAGTNMAKVMTRVALGV